MKAHEKGTDLERAITAIEGCILRATPELAKTSYKIYTRRIIVVGGVKHEIDIWVEFDLGNNYKSVFIFESRNRQEKVSKDDIIIFGKKIEAAQAQRGFFVARLFGRYAIAAAKLDPRMTILKVNQNLMNNNVVERIQTTRSPIMITVAWAPPDLGMRGITDASGSGSPEFWQLDHGAIWENKVLGQSTRAGNDRRRIPFNQLCSTATTPIWEFLLYLRCESRAGHADSGL
jgi:hypothetical protein